MPVRLKFHGELKDLLNGPIDCRGYFRDLHRLAPIKDLIESQGVPHTEVGIILSGGVERHFLFTPTQGETVDVLPHSPPVDVACPSLLFPEPFGRVAFVVDVNVARLASLLRLTGFDTLYDPRWGDEKMADVAGECKRILLTRDKELLKRNSVLRGRLIRSQYPWRQLAEVIHFFGLKDRIELFTRCPKCNVPLVHTDKGDVIEDLEPLTRLMYDRFTRCPGCGQVYWSGSHHSRIREKLAEALGEL